MSTYESLSHSKWDCKYHIVFVPKGRKKALYGKVRKFLGPVFRELAAQRRSEILEGHMVQDHVHMLIRIPPKYSVAEVVGYLKEKSAIAVARQFGSRKRNFNPRSRGSGTRRRFLTGIQAKKDINVFVLTKRSHLSSVEALTCFAREDIDQRAYKRLCSLCL
jgi:putative transposase